MRTLAPEDGYIYIYIYIYIYMSIASKGDIEGLSPQLLLSVAMSLGVVMHEWIAPLRSAYVADT